MNCKIKCLSPAAVNDDHGRHTLYSHEAKPIEEILASAPARKCDQAKRIAAFHASRRKATNINIVLAHRNNVGHMGLSADWSNVFARNPSLHF